jgi:recombination protein RecT
MGTAAQVAAQAAEKKGTTTLMEKTVVDIVSEKVKAFMDAGRIDLPKDYSVDNALKTAYLALNDVKDKDGNNVMVDGRLTGVVTTASVANAVLDMVIQGLNPAKDQCYFLVYGKSLACFRSYFGSMAVAEMVNPAIKDWGYNVVYQGDKFSYGIHNGKASVIEHEQKLENIDKTKIIAAYAMALDKEGNPIKSEIMTIEQIHQSWKQSPLKPFDAQGNLKPDSNHAKFPADMALRTVINKVGKFLIKASSDNTLLLERINRSEELADAAAAQAEIEERANAGSLLMISQEGGNSAQAEGSKTDSPADGQTDLSVKGTGETQRPVQPPVQEQEKPKERRPAF